MALPKELEKEIENEVRIERIRRKRDQAWELAGCARMDGDKTDEALRTEDDHEEPTPKSPGVDPAYLVDWIIVIGVFAIVYLLWCAGNPQSGNPQ